MYKCRLMNLGVPEFYLGSGDLHSVGLWLLNTQNLTVGGVLHPFLMHGDRGQPGSRHRFVPAALASSRLWPCGVA